MVSSVGPKFVANPDINVQLQILQVQYHPGISAPIGRLQLRCWSKPEAGQHDVASSLFSMSCPFLFQGGL